MEKPVPPVYGKINYIDFLSKDPLLAAVLAGQELRTINKTDNVTLYLYSTIIQQQLSGRVGEVILKRFMDMFGGRAPTSAEVVATLVENFRAIGISVAKAGYIKNIAQFDLDNGLDMKKLSLMTDEEVITYITAIKGIGKWTAHLFLWRRWGVRMCSRRMTSSCKKLWKRYMGLTGKIKRLLWKRCLLFLPAGALIVRL
jgi:3-methyladenine DNA glycosylase/8-oxoguanine DNA glycosylase